MRPVITNIERMHKILAQEWPLAEDFFKLHPIEVKFGRTMREDWSASSLYLSEKNLSRLHFVFYKIQGKIYAVDPMAHLGTGSLGSVKLGLDRQGQYYAIKVQLDDKGIDENVEQEILDLLGRSYGCEVRPWSSLLRHHRVHKGANLKTKYLVTQYIEGQDLDYYLTNLKNKAKEINKIEAYQIAYQCAKAVEVLHKMDIIHADISARNYIINKTANDLTIEIIDFGLARKLPKNKTAIDVPIEKMSGIPKFIKGFLINNKIYHYTKSIDIYLLGKMFINELGLSDEIMFKMCDEDPAKRPSIKQGIMVLKNLIKSAKK